mmetsp:Transcript_23328/g.88492  ORF Transcript_23328/g.88492 Transcript_23328/m.88492 type:complete len:209 (-) Transcript_23328:381-1007(-)
MAAAGASGASGAASVVWAVGVAPSAAPSVALAEARGSASTEPAAARMAAAVSSLAEAPADLVWRRDARASCASATAPFTLEAKWSAEDRKRLSDDSSATAADAFGATIESLAMAAMRARRLASSSTDTPTSPPALGESLATRRRRTRPGHCFDWHTFPLQPSSHAQRPESHAPWPPPTQSGSHLGCVQAGPPHSSWHWHLPVEASHSP